MSKKWQYRDESKDISKSVLENKSTQELEDARDFISGLLGLRKLEKLVKTYINGTSAAVEYNEKEKVFVDYRIDGTSTGRLSCAAYTAGQKMGVSFHTLPRETENNIRSIFVAPPNHAFITVDYSAMELRVLAHIAREGRMQQAFCSGKDLHTYTARLLFDKEVISKEERQIAKTVSFLIVYGGGAYNLAETMSIPLKRAEKIINNYKNVYPGVFEFMEFVNEFIKTNKYAYTIFGRRRNLPNVDSRHRAVVNRAYRQGLNFTIQSSSSDILLCSLLGIYNEFKTLGMKSKIVSTVHDSIELIAPYDEIKDACDIIYNQMVNYPLMKEKFNIHFDIPFAIETIVGKSFGDGVEVKYEDGKAINISDVRKYLEV